MGTPLGIRHGSRQPATAPPVQLPGRGEPDPPHARFRPAPLVRPRMCSRTMALLGAIDGALLLHLAKKDNTFVLRKSGAPLVGDIVLALSFGERDDRNFICPGQTALWILRN